MDLRSFQRILFFQTAFLGDAILAIPALKNLRLLFPAARLALVCRKGLGEFFLATGLVDQVIEVDKKKSVSLKEAFLKTREYRPDLVISAHRSFRTALWVWRLHPAMSVGFRDPWSAFAYHRRVRRPDEKHDVHRQLSLLEPWKDIDGAVMTVPPSLKVDLPPAAGDTKAAGFGITGKAVAMAPGSQWSTKRWTLEGFVQVAESLSQGGYQIVLLGTANEKEICDQIEKKISGCVNLCGRTTVLEMARVLSQCRAFVGNDSGAMHVATAVGTPVTAVFGPTVPSQGYAPWSEKSRVVEVELSCRPCGAHGHESCPLGTHDCMKKVPVSMVLNAVREFLS